AGEVPRRSGHPRGGTARERTALRASDSLAFFRAPIRAEVDGLTVSGFADQHSSYLRELYAGKRESFTSELFLAAIRPGSVVVDASAHVGYHTLLAARRAGTRGRVLSFEPHPRSFHCLQRNLRENGLSDRVFARRESLGDTVGIATLGDHDGSSNHTFLARAPGGGRAVVCTTLDDALEGGRCVDVMKLDVRGRELNALRGMRRALAGSPRLRLFVRYDPAALRQLDIRPIDLLAELGELGFQLQVIDEEHRRLAPLEELQFVVERGARGANLLCTLASGAAR
ncbi:MAG: FkbM family methyltransferase, partial [Gaiellaceae bacterium]